jgi:glycosyltransferase involved in cell wall biosynthesis
MNTAALPKVSVIVPVYNAEKYLDETLSSITGQTLRDIEIICVNDGSTDSSLKILTDYAAKDSRIRIIDQENHGAGAARNAGLDCSHGEYLSFLDTDDIFAPTLLEELYTSAVMNDSDAVICNSDVLDDSTKEKYYEPWKIPAERLGDQKFLKPYCSADIPQKALEGFIPWTWDKLFRAKYIKANKILFSHLKYSEDHYFVIPAMLLANKIVTINKILVTYRTCNPLSRESSHHKFSSESFESVRMIKQFLVQNSIYVKYEKSFINWSLQYAIWVMMNMIQKTKVAEDTARTVEIYYSCLRDVFFPELGYEKYDENFFHDKNIYKTYRDIKENDLLTFLVKTLKDQYSVLDSQNRRPIAVNNTVPVNKKNNVRIFLRKFIKGILPYGLVRIIQTIKRRRK